MLNQVKGEVPQEMDIIPFLDYKALETYIALDSNYRSKPSPVLSTGIALLGRYREI